MTSQVSINQTGAPLQPGIIVNGRYRVVRSLGSGGFGRTYLVSDEQGGEQQWVLKEFCPSTSQNERALEKARELFQRESAVLGKIDNPQVPFLHGSFEWEGRLCLVQQYVEGQTYWQRFKENQSAGVPCDEAEVRDMLSYLLPLLESLHRQKIYHRDITPDNIIKPADGGKPVLIDFGAVKQKMTTLLATGSDQAQASVIGKMGYASPEQMRGIEPGPARDIYSLGATALVLLTNQEPEALINQQDLSWDWRSHCEVSEELGQILDRMVADRPRDRYSNAGNILLELNAPRKTKIDEPRGSETSPRQAKPPETEIEIIGETPETESSAPPEDTAPAQRSPIPSTPKKSLPATLIGGTVAGAAAILLGGSWVAIPHTPLCRQFQRCVGEEGWNETYTAAITNVEAVENQQSSLVSAQELGQAVGSLDGAIADLESLPELALDYEQAQEALKRARSLYQQLSEQQKIAQTQEDVTQAIEQGNQTLTAAKTAQELEDALANTRKVLMDLKALSPNQPGYQAAQQQIPAAEKTVTALQERMEAENTATAKLKEAEELAKAATKATEKASQTKKLPEYQAAATAWEKAIAPISNTATFANTTQAATATQRLEEYQKQRSAMNTRVAALTPTPPPQPVLSNTSGQRNESSRSQSGGRPSPRQSGSGGNVRPSGSFTDAFPVGQ
ncbi:MAG: protein kinase [Cyanobacteria bacterium P01_C01_bin.89]